MSSTASNRSVQLTDFIHSYLTQLDYTSIATNACVVAVSFLLFCLLYCLSAAVASRTWTYNKLKMKEKVFWNLAVVRGVFGVFASAVGMWTIWVDTELAKDVVFGKTPTSYFAVDVTTGFFALECTALLITDLIFKQQNILLNIHHWLALGGGFLVLHFGSSHYFCTVALLLEMSTPFSALCWTMLKCGRADTLLWKVNQAILVHLFHCRTILEGYLWLQTYRHWNRIWSSMPLPIFVNLYTQLTLIFFVMTPYWTYKKTVQMHTPVDWNFGDFEKSKSTNDCKKTE